MRTHSFVYQVATAAPEEPKYFGEGINMWRSNWLTIKDNKWYMLSTVLTYTCNYGVFPAFVAYTVQVRGPCCPAPPVYLCARAEWLESSCSLENGAG